MSLVELRVANLAVLSDRRLAAQVPALEGSERLAEISRLMSGRDTAAARARAAELLVEGRRTPEVGCLHTMAPR